jgi:hypothetical protein
VVQITQRQPPRQRIDWSAEDRAAIDRVGLWQDNEPTPPWAAKNGLSVPGHMPRADVRQTNAVQICVRTIFCLCHLVGGNSVLCPVDRPPPLLSQSFDAFAAGSFGGSTSESDRQLAQTFTVSLPGRLVGIDVQVRTSNAAPPTEDLVLEIFPTVSGVPVEDESLALASVLIQAEDVPPFVPLTGDFITVDLRAFSIFVTPGDVLAIVLGQPGPGSYVWLASFEGQGETYPDGVGFSRRFDPTWGRLIPETDFGFRTYVPEPSTLALLGGAFVAAAWTRRRRPRQGHQ